jgi:hypothetical protein
LKMLDICALFESFQDASLRGKQLASSNDPLTPDVG